MSTFDDDDIEFDFFDEPETVEATQRRRLPRIERPRSGGRPPRQPIAPGGFTPLLRLVGLVALMIFIVVVLVFWVRSCQGASKRAGYQHYMEHVTAIAQESQRVGQQFSSVTATPGTTKSSTLATKVRGFAQQAAGQVADAEGLQPPGPLRSVHQHLVDTLQLRLSGLARFADALDQTASARDASQAATKLVAQGQLLAASDVDWEYFFHEGAVQTLQSQHVTGVQVPHSRFLTNPELVGADSMTRLWTAVHGTGGGGTSGGANCPCGDALDSVKVLPAGTPLSTSSPTTIKSSTELAFSVTVSNSGKSQNVGVPVKLTIGSFKPVTQTIDLISPGDQKTVTFANLPTNLPFGPEVKVTVTVGPVPGESNLGNNTATYPVFFSL